MFFITFHVVAMFPNSKIFVSSVTCFIFIIISLIESLFVINRPLLEKVQAPLQNSDSLYESKKRERALLKEYIIRECGDNPMTQEEKKDFIKELLLSSGLDKEETMHDLINDFKKNIISQGLYNDEMEKMINNLLERFNIKNILE